MNSSSSFHHLFIFTVAVVFLRCSYPTGAATCHPDDEAGLLAFKSGITQDRTGILSSWKKGTDCCSSWRFISCQDGRVNSLNIYRDMDVVGGGGFLSGTISPSLAKLHYLNGFYLIGFKNITGSIPQSLFQMPKLEALHIEDCGLSGSLPANISTQSKLTWLYVKDNFLTGTIPQEFANLKKMKSLDLSGNHLSGTIPNIIKSMTLLKDLHLSRNNFSGELLQFITSFPQTTPIKELDLSWNQFSGTVPKNLSRRVNILNLSHNLLTDPLPVLKGIQTLDLSYNKFNLKTIPEWITSSRNIDTLKLAKCGIKMSLENWTIKPKENWLTYVIIIDLSENQISGNPSRLLEYQPYLREFRASGNKLRFDMGKLNFSTELETLDLSRNLLFGKVPATVAGLHTLDLSQNHLCGKLPVTEFPANAFAGNDCLCGSPLAPCKT